MTSNDHDSLATPDRALLPVAKYGHTLPANHLTLRPEHRAEALASLGVSEEQIAALGRASETRR